MVTTLLGAMARGEPGAKAQLYAIVYEELRRIARGALRKSPGPVTIEPTMLVHEAFLKLAGDASRELTGSHHFYSLLARAMRQVILDTGRASMTPRHGAGLVRATLSESLPREGARLEDLLAMDQALRRLESLDPELADLVELHFFAGVSFVEIAAIRGVTERTVRRHWDAARAFLLDAMPDAL